MTWKYHRSFAEFARAEIRAHVEDRLVASELDFDAELQTEDSRSPRRAATMTSREGGRVAGRRGRKPGAAGVEVRGPTVHPPG